MSRRLPLLSSAASTRNAGARSPVASTALSTVANAAVSIPMKPPVSPAQWNITDLLSELQSRGLRWQTDVGLSRVGGAGPSDHKALRLSGQTVMVPIFTHWAKGSPYEVRDEDGCTILYRDALRVGPVDFPKTPRFYSRQTAEGVPYFKIATLHAADVLASTVLQNCVRYSDRATSCQFCAIGQSLRSRATIPRKTPQQLAEVTRAAVELDGVTQVVLTTGTPPTPDRGARLLTESVGAITEQVDIAVQVQCEPPEDFVWFQRLKQAGATTLGMHLEAVTEPVRRRIMPGKSELSLDSYFDAFEAAVEVFGRGEVTTYILAGLGDSHDDIVRTADRLSRIGVYPFVVPFVPIVGTPLQDHPAPDPLFMNALLDDIADVLFMNQLGSQDASAGCGRCGACSTLRSREARLRSIGSLASASAGSGLGGAGQELSDV